MQFLHKNSFLFVIAFISFVAPATGQVAFEELTYAEAITKAKKEGKFVFIDFRAEWCKPCKTMELTTFTDTSIGNYLNARAICIQIDINYSEDKEVKSVYKVDQIPTILILNPVDTSVQLRIIGYKPAHILLGDLKFAMASNEMSPSKTNKDAKNPETSTKKRKFKKRLFRKTQN